MGRRIAAMLGKSYGAGHSQLFRMSSSLKKYTPDPLLTSGARHLCRSPGAPTNNKKGT